MSLGGGRRGDRAVAADPDLAGVQVVAGGAVAGLLVVVLAQHLLPLLLLLLDLLGALERRGEVLEHAAAEAGAGLAVAADGAHQRRPAGALRGPVHGLVVGLLGAVAHRAPLDAL